jgi:hypothetical protein
VIFALTAPRYLHGRTSCAPGRLGLHPRQRAGRSVGPSRREGLRWTAAFFSETPSKFVAPGPPPPRAGRCRCNRGQPASSPARGTSAGRANQIKRAGAAQGWVVESRAPGLLRGTLSRRDQQAVVDIPYDARRFSIRYVRSSNLNYDGTNISSTTTAPSSASTARS